MTPSHLSTATPWRYIYGVVYKYVANLASDHAFQHSKLFTIIILLCTYCTYSQWSTTPTPVISTTVLTKRSSRLLERVDSLATTADLPIWIRRSRLVKAVSYSKYSKLTTLKRNIASKGGHASRGKFEPGSERAKEAGRKGGHAVHHLDQPEE